MKHLTTARKFFAKFATCWEGGHSGQVWPAAGGMFQSLSTPS